MSLSYYGPNSGYYNVVAGDKYASVSIGEKLNLTERTALTISAFDNQLITPTSIGNSRESGLRLDYQHSFYERTSLKAYVAPVSAPWKRFVRTTSASRWEQPTASRRWEDSRSPGRHRRPP